MFPRVRIAALALGLAVVAQPAMAGPRGDALAACLVKSTSAAEQTELMVWLFGAIGRHPAARQYTTMTDAQREAATKRAADIMQRLILDACRAESLATIRYEGAEALQNAFSTLGEKAMEGLAADPAVAQVLEGMATYMDQKRFEQLGRDAAKTR